MRTFMFSLAACLSLAGCSPGASAVDPSKARAALTAALESWKQGERPENLQARTPAVTVQDMDWQAGFALLAYQVVGDGADDALNLRCPVKLQMRDSRGRTVERAVTYVVGTSPVTTVFREFSM